MGYYSSLIDNAGLDSKALFRNINRLLHRKPHKLYLSCTSATDLANNFANFFTETIATVKEQLANRVTFSPTVTLSDTPKLDCELTTLSPTTVKELRQRSLARLHPNHVVLIPCLLDCFGSSSQ